MKKRSQKLVQTGITGLDEIFLGGIRRGNVILIEGLPGTGKTNLGLEFIYRGAKEFKENGIIISFESSSERLHNDALEFGWDFEALKKKKQHVRIIHMSPAELFDDLLSLDSQIIKEIKLIGAKRVLIDGITPLKHFSGFQDPSTFRKSLFSLIENLQLQSISAVFTRELTEGQDVIGPDEQYICDTVITLSNHTSHNNVTRSLEIKKSRGQDFISGKHTFKITDKEGLQVYRRVQSRPKEFLNKRSSEKRISTGVETLDTIMGNGILEGSVTLNVGISGTGKTVLALQFLAEGAKNGENGLFVSLDESFGQIYRNAKTLKIGVEKYINNEQIKIHTDAPLELELDVHFTQIMKLIEENDIRRVVLDSVVGYEHGKYESGQQFIYALVSYLKNRFITTMLNYESPELLGLSQISQTLKASAVVDNIILLNYVEISTQMRRAITVPKSRASAIPQRTREFIIKEGGIFIVEEDLKEEEMVPQLPFSSYYGILSRAPARHSPVIENAIAQGEGIPESHH